MDIQNICYIEDTFFRMSNNNMAEAQNPCS